MFIIIYLMTFGLLFLFNPILENITSLQNTSYNYFYYIYVLCITCFLCYEVFKLTNKLNKNYNILIIIFSISFLLGALLPYQPQVQRLFETLHVACSLIGCIGLLYIEKELISCLITVDYQRGYALYRYFIYFTMILGTLAIMFGSINGIIEIYFITTNLFILYKLDYFLFKK